ncbi:ADP-glyceromanno-heptose 6-epimerase precursor [Methylobacterium phyllostachyos]|uniref:ADP-L-glycero-D-manno-heptose-6-epimerase n=1 Tax=Methylobacterium phyllostachyos TaxID=582672 RepID=A0A1H0I5U1_9HYPH|nr:ADP-glyceromanno-heptose 6-epimerase [Methylobacterium phyllostachyos]SDO26451.1 ADP-glyceromanno-heptose 6-epimerase precursor [Methylobacterium phyllostachyos]
MYLVTGGAGMIGSNIAAELAAAGHAVVVCDWLRQDERWRNLAKHEIADIIMPEDLFRWLAQNGNAVAGIIHMGAISATTETDVDSITHNNIRLTLDLWAWCTDHGVPLIYASSAATYGDGHAGFDDMFSPDALARFRPLNAYGWSKHFIDRRIARIVAQGQPTPPQWVGLKFFNVYGPNEYHKGSMKSVVAHNAARVAAGEPLRLFRSYRADYTDGGQLRDFIYVKDCARVVTWLLEHPGVSGLFNLGTGQARSWLDLGRSLFAALDLPEAIEFIEMPEQLRGKYQYYTKAEMERLRAAGYAEPFTSLEDGVSDYVRGYLRQDDPYR